MIETNDNPQHRTTSAVENYIAANRQLVNKKTPSGLIPRGLSTFSSRYWKEQYLGGVCRMESI